MRSETPTKLALLAAILPLAACATPTPVLTSSALDTFEPIRGSVRDTCETQKQIAEHNSKYDTLKKGKAVVYKAPCAMEKATS